MINVGDYPTISYGPYGQNRFLYNSEKFGLPIELVHATAHIVCGNNPVNCHCCRQATRTYFVNGLRRSCRTVPAVADVWRPHATQCHKPRPVDQALRRSQLGHRKPRGQRS